MHWALNRGHSAKHSTWYPRVLKLWMVFAKRWTSSCGDPPKSNMLCTGVQTLQKIKPNQQWPTIHGEGPQHENHCNAQGQNVQEEFNNRSSSRQLQPSSNQVQSKFQEHAINKHVMLWSSAAGVFHMALPSSSWPLGSYIIRSSLYLSSSCLQHVQIKCKQLQEHPKNRAVKNCPQVELQNHDNCENCCIHRPMSPHVSNCMQVTSNYLQMKTVDINSKNSEMNITWTEITKHEESKTGATVKHLQNRCTASAR